MIPRTLTGIRALAAGDGDAEEATGGDILTMAERLPPVNLYGFLCGDHLCADVRGLISARALHWRSSTNCHYSNSNCHFSLCLSPLPLRCSSPAVRCRTSHRRVARVCAQVTADAGLIEAVPDTISIDALKKNDPNFVSLIDFFHRYYGTGRAFRKSASPPRACRLTECVCVFV